jgi:hypothetical protein
MIYSLHVRFTCKDIHEVFRDKKGLLKFSKLFDVGIEEFFKEQEK